MATEHIADELRFSRRLMLTAAPKLKEYVEMQRLMSSLYQELFSIVPGWNVAQQKLNRQAKKLYNAIHNASFRELRELAYC